MRASFWIKKENVTPELIKSLQFWGYKQNQDYFNENGWDILMTTHSTKSYMFAQYNLAYSNNYPHTTWLSSRDYCETSAEMIDKLNDVG